MDFDLTSGVGGAGAAGPEAEPKPDAKNALVRLVLERGLPLLSVDDIGEPVPRVGEWSPNRRPYSDTVPVGDGRGEIRVEGGASRPRL